MSIAELFIRRPVMTTLVMLAILLFGIPREAIAISAVEETLPLKAIARRLIALLGSNRAIRV